MIQEKNFIAFFIDYEKCFDKIDRTFLSQKLISEKVSCKLVNAIRSMYITVKSCVRYNSSYSEFFSLNNGLKQGDPSLPLLFMFFVNDIVDNINSDLEHVFTPKELKLFLIMYADDQVVFAKSPETLQSILHDIETYCTIWGLKINTTKTKAMIFEKGRHTYYDFYICNKLIDVVESFKYLGMTLFLKMATGIEVKNVNLSMHHLHSTISSPFYETLNTFTTVCPV